MDLPRPIPLFRDLFVITDPGRDLDDEDVLVGLNRMIRIGILNVLGVVANMAPAKQRARLAKGTLNILGQTSIPVGVGSACLQPDDDGLDYQFNVGYLASTTEIRDGKRLILKTLREAKPKGVVLLLISGLTDAASVLKNHRELFTSKVRRVVIMGGVVADGDAPKLDEHGHIQPDNANNHTFDMASAKFLYKELQDAEIPITVLTRHAAAAAKVSRSMYDEMADTGHPIGIRLRDTQKVAIEHLWRRACLPADHPDRQGLPNDRDKNWFCKAFCGGKGTERSIDESIWDLIQTFNLYDPCTLIAAVPNLREHFFAPQVVEVGGAEHMIIGVSAKHHNVRNPAELGEFIRVTLVESLQQSLEYARCNVA